MPLSFTPGRPGLWLRLMLAIFFTAIQMHLKVHNNTTSNSYNVFELFDPPCIYYVEFLQEIRHCFLWSFDPSACLLPWVVCVWTCNPADLKAPHNFEDNTVEMTAVGEARYVAHLTWAGMLPGWLLFWFAKCLVQLVLISMSLLCECCSVLLVGNYFSTYL